MPDSGSADLGALLKFYVVDKGLIFFRSFNIIEID